MINFLAPTLNRVSSNCSAVKETSLADLKPGQVGRVSHFGSLPASQRSALQAYGLTPGRPVTVLQQSPVTIIQVEYTELAFEHQISRQVFIQKA